MQTPLEVDFRNIPPSEALSAAIRKRADKLEHFFTPIMRCHVTIECPHHHHHQGVRYAVHIRITVPGKEIVASRDHAAPVHEDAMVAIRDAFDAAQRQLEDYARVRRGDIKQHSPESKPA